MKTKSSNDLFKVTIAALGIVFVILVPALFYALRVCFAGSHGLAVTDQNIYGEYL